MTLILNKDGPFRGIAKIAPQAAAHHWYENRDVCSSCMRSAKQMFESGDFSCVAPSGVGESARYGQGAVKYSCICGYDTPNISNYAAHGHTCMVATATQPHAVDRPIDDDPDVVASPQARTHLNRASSLSLGPRYPRERVMEHHWDPVLRRCDHCGVVREDASAAACDPAAERSKQKRAAELYHRMMYGFQTREEAERAIFEKPATPAHVALTKSTRSVEDWDAFGVAMDRIRPSDVMPPTAAELALHRAFNARTSAAGSDVRMGCPTHLARRD